MVTRCYKALETKTRSYLQHQLSRCSQWFKRDDSLCFKCPHARIMWSQWKTSHSVTSLWTTKWWIALNHITRCPCIWDDITQHKTLSTLQGISKLPSALDPGCQDTFFVRNQIELQMTENRLQIKLTRQLHSIFTRLITIKVIES